MATIQDKAQLQSLTEAINKDDDWSGMDSAARRKRQNRLNQRAYRRRKAQQAQAAQSQPDTITGTLEYRQSPTQTSAIPSSSSSSLVLAHPPLIPYFTPTNSTIHGPVIFPLTPDHLIILVQYNVLRATLTNLSIMSLLHALPYECTNALSIPPQSVPSPPGTIPPSLSPTEVQKNTPHDFWIDILPLGHMRDNVILSKGRYDEDDLCCDMIGGLFEGYNDLEMKGILVWGDPWCADGYEVTEGFLRKWGWLLNGCGELIEASNRWRGLRGEEPLVVEI